ncbi:MAG: hypothetical protein JWQ40_3367 [Segetibacter sp.]|nr:hypothetical protein [Segetibacter sp.]
MKDENKCRIKDAWRDKDERSVAITAPLSTTGGKLNITWQYCEPLTGKEIAGKENWVFMKKASYEAHSVILDI